MKIETTTFVAIIGKKAIEPEQTLGLHNQIYHGLITDVPVDIKQAIFTGINLHESWKIVKVFAKKQS